MGKEFLSFNPSCQEDYHVNCLCLLFWFSLTPATYRVGKTSASVCCNCRSPIIGSHPGIPNQRNYQENICRADTSCQKINANFFCTNFLDNPSGHGRPHRKSWMSAPESAFSCGPGSGQKLFDPWGASGRKGQECPREIRTKKFMFMLLFLPWHTLIFDIIRSRLQSWGLLSQDVRLWAPRHVEVESPKSTPSKAITIDRTMERSLVIIVVIIGKANYATELWISYSSPSSLLRCSFRPHSETLKSCPMCFFKNGFKCNWVDHDFQTLKRGLCKQTGYVICHCAYLVNKLLPQECCILPALVPSMKQWPIRQSIERDIQLHHPMYGSRGWRYWDGAGDLN